MDTDLGEKYIIHYTYGCDYTMQVRLDHHRYLSLLFCIICSALYLTLGVAYWLSNLLIFLSYFIRGS